MGGLAILGNYLLAVGYGAPVIAAAVGLNLGVLTRLLKDRKRK